MPLAFINREGMLRAIMGSALAALLLCAAAPAKADDDDDGGPDIKLFKSILSAVGLERDGTTIDYHERSPLVIPPSSTLPPPVSGEVKNPNWPVDPEVRRKREVDAATSKSARATGDKFIDESRPLLPSEIEKGRDKSKRGTGSGYTEWTGKPMQPSELGSPGLFNQLGNVFSTTEKEESKKFTSEPPRTSLLAPPPGYQTPSPSQPYGLGKDRSQDPKAANYSETHGTLEGVR
jgi:hypothetical protein